MGTMANALRKAGLLTKQLEAELVHNAQALREYEQARVQQQAQAAKPGSRDRNEAQES